MDFITYIIGYECGWSEKLVCVYVSHQLSYPINSKYLPLILPSPLRSERWFFPFYVFSKLSVTSIYLTQLVDNQCHIF